MFKVIPAELHSDNRTTENHENTLNCPETLIFTKLPRINR